MHIPLYQFEQIIDEKILQRGLNYFDKGYVTELNEISANTYEAIVSGTEEYNLNLKIENNEVIDYNCDCPYDMGPVCKHLVAVLFYLQKDQLTLDDTTPKKRNTGKKNKSVKAQIAHILKTISHKELKEFTLKTVENDRTFRNLFLASFSNLNENQSQQFYQKQISAVLKSAAGRDGYIDWSEMSRMNTGLQPFLENAEVLLRNASYQTLIHLSTALLEEMVEAFQYGDDSNGDIGYHVNFAMEMLTTVSKMSLPKEVRKDFFKYCISAFEKKLFSGWDWHLEILEVAAELIDNEKEEEIVFKYLKNFEDGYEAERAQVLELRLLQKYRGAKAAQEFVEQHINNSKIREAEIEKAYASENYERAIQLAKSGIDADRQKKPGLLSVWYDWLLKIAEAQNNHPKIVEYARYRLLNNFMGTRDYYQILKERLDPSQWELEVEKIIEDIQSQNRWTDWSRVREIYVKENYWDRLLKSIQENPDLRAIEQYEPYLKEKYGPELIEIYSKEIKDFLQNNVGRKHYQTSCRYLRRMKKLGATRELLLLINYLKEQYSNRPALMDELSKV